MNLFFSSGYNEDRHTKFRRLESLHKSIFTAGLWAILSCFLTSTKSSAQAGNVQSKKQSWELLSQKITDSTRQDVYNTLGRIYFIESWIDKKIIDSAFYYLHKSIYLQDSVNEKNSELTNEGLRLLGQTYIYAGDTATAKKIFRQVVGLARRDKQQLNEADTWRLLAKELWVREVNDKSIPAYYDSAIAIYHQLGLAVRAVEMNVEKMYFFSQKGNSAAAEKEYQAILSEAEKDGRKNFSCIYKMLASEERFKGNLNKALNYSLESVKNLDKTPNKEDYQLCYGELAQVYEELGETEKSIYWYKKCIDERIKGHYDQYTIFRTVSLMVKQMIKAGQEKQALKYLELLMKDHRPENLVQKGIIAQSMAYCYVALKEYNLAEEKFISMISAYKEEEFNLEILQIAYYDVGKFYADIREYAKAKPFLDKALEIDGSAGRMRDLNLLLFKVDSANGNLSAAIKDFQTFKNLNDSIFSQDRSRQVEELMIRYETEKKDQDIKLLENESTTQKRDLAFANQTKNWIIGVAVLFLVIIGLLINNSRLKQQTNKKLQVQQTEIERKNISLQHLVEEKDWLVKEIHHRVKNNFHMVMGLLGTQSSYLKSEEAINSMTESKHRIHAMSLIHQKLYQSDNLSAINMADYVHELVEYLKDCFNTRQAIRFILDIDPVELNIANAVPLGLIMNESITNAIKYAFTQDQEKKIFISFKRIGSDQLELIIRDNGTGMPAGFDVNNPKSMGLRLMKGLSDDIDGKFEIKNDQGVRVSLIFLYDPAKINGKQANADNVT